MDDRPDHESDVTAETVAWAYRLFLDREPSADELTQQVQKASSTDELRRSFLTSHEFWQKNPSSVSSGDVHSGEPMSIDLDVSAEMLEALLAHTEATWRMLGDSEPHWSVLSDDRYLGSSIESNMDAFWKSGSATLEKHMALLTSNGVNVSDLRSALEYGCGVGRMTRALAHRFDEVDAYDVSSSHLKLAAEAVADSPGQTRLHQVRSVESLSALPRSDLVYSVLVLQHNPPPIMRETLRHLLGAVAPAGFGVVQLPTYSQGYTFDAQRYLWRPRRWWRKQQRQIEMHVLPQREVFALVEASGCRLLEVLEDDAAGPRFVSSLFVVAR